MFGADAIKKRRKNLDYTGGVSSSVFCERE